MNKSRIIKIAIAPLRSPLICPFRISLGQHDILDNLLFTLTLVDGTQGFGEAAVATHITGETISETKNNLNTVGQKLIGKNISDYLKISSLLHEQLPTNKAAVAAVEMAIVDAFTRQKKIPLWKFFGAKSKRIATDITIVISALSETEKTVKKFYAQGFRAFKVKIGRDEDIDLQRITAVKKHAPRSRIYLDANQAYTAAQTIKFLEKLKRLRIVPDLIEQPVKKNDWEGLKKLSKTLKVPVCADESASSLFDVKRIIKEKCVRAINIKLMKFGIFEAREAALLAKKNNLKLMIGGMMESSLAMTAAAHLASGLNCFDFVDLDTPFFVKNDQKQNPFLTSSGIYDVSKVKSGIGILPQ